MMKNYSLYKDSNIEGIGKIPKHWEIKRLKYVAKVQPSNVDKKFNEEEKKVFLCNYMNVYNNEFINCKIQFMEASALTREVEKFLLNNGDVLVTKDSETAEDIAIAALVTEELKNVLCGYHLTHIRPDKKHLLGEYLFRLFQANGFRNQFVVEANGVTRYGLDKYSFNNALILLPPLPEQKQITDYLDIKIKHINLLIEKKQKLIGLLKEQRTSIINQAVTRGLDPNAPMRDSGIEWLGDIPEHWEVKKVKHFSTVINGSTPKSSVPEYWDGDIVWITPDDLGKLGTKEIFDSQRKISQDGLNSCGTTIIPKDSIVLSTRAPIGHLGLTTVESCTNQGCKTLVPNLHLIDSNYLFYLMYSARDELQSLGQGSTFIELQSQKLKDSKMPLPSLPEQQNIVRKLDEWSGKIETVVEEYKKSINLLKEYRTALISEVAIGKIDVREENPA